jgi:hypothetical protein
MEGPGGKVELTGTVSQIVGALACQFKATGDLFGCGRQWN